MECYPDNPIIKNYELTGYPERNEPKMLKCPICKMDTNWVYRNTYSFEIVGCEWCTKLIDFYEEV